jgi:hypothetical protein
MPFTYRFERGWITSTSEDTDGARRGARQRQNRFVTSDF